MFTFQTADKRLIDRVGQHDSVKALLLEHVDVLGLLDLIGHIEDLVLMLFLGSFQVLAHGEILAFQVLVDDIILHLLGELFVLDAAELDKWINVIPVFLIAFTVCLAHTGQLVCHLLGNVIGNLPDKTIILQGRSGNVQRQVRTVDNALEQHQEFRNDFLNVICDEDLIVVELDGTFNGLILHVDPREIEDTLEVEGIVHVQMDPEERLLVIIENLAVEGFIFLFFTLVRMLGPQGMDLIHQLRTLVNLVAGLLR